MTNKGRHALEKYNYNLMLTITGTLKKDELKEFIKKDNSSVKKRIIYIEPKNSIFPIKISIEDQSLNLGNLGEEISLGVIAYPYYFKDGRMVKANLNFYVPKK